MIKSLYKELHGIAATVNVRAQPVCVSISQAAANLKQLQVRALLKGLSPLQSPALSLSELLTEAQ